MVASLRTEGGSACPAVFAAAAPPGRTANDRSRRLVQIRDASVTHRRRYRSTRNGSREGRVPVRSEEHTSELQSLMRISYAVFCLKKKKQNKQKTTYRKSHST